MSMMPAFSPGPCTTSFERVGSRFKWTRDDLYEQCSLHITLKIPSSVSEGSRPSHFRTFLYSSGVMPCSATTSGVIATAAAGVVGIREALFSHEAAAVSLRHLSFVICHLSFVLPGLGWVPHPLRIRLLGGAKGGWPGLV